MNEIKTIIIRKIMHNPGMHFNELWNKEVASNKFAYHLKGLEEGGIVEKKQEGYYLTREGKEYVAFLDGESGMPVKAPLFVVALAVFKRDKVLMLERKKEPFYDYWGLPGGKMEFDQYILETAKKELKEETGFEADLVLKGLLSTKAFSKDKQSYNHQIFVVRADNPKGELLAETREGKNKWVDLKDVDKLKIYPDIPKVLEMCFNEKFSIVQMDRYLENDCYLGFDNVKEIID